MKPFLFVFLIAVIVSCTSKKERSDEFKDPAYADKDASGQTGESENLFQLESYLVQGKVNGADVQTISTSSVLVVNPTEEQIAAMEKAYGEDFPTIADDASFYQSNAVSVIDSLGISKVDAEKPFALLVGKASPWTLNLRRAGAAGWMIILFNENKTPMIVPAIDVNKEMLKNYFDLK